METKPSSLSVSLKIRRALIAQCRDILVMPRRNNDGYLVVLVGNIDGTVVAVFMNWLRLNTFEVKHSL